MIELKLTTEETNVLRQLIHAAVKSLGLDGAEAGVVLDKKIQAAIKEAEDKKEDKE